MSSASCLTSWSRAPEVRPRLKYKSATTMYSSKDQRLPAGSCSATRASCHGSPSRSVLTCERLARIGTLLASRDPRRHPHCAATLGGVVIAPACPVPPLASKAPSPAVARHAPQTEDQAPPPRTGESPVALEHAASRFSVHGTTVPVRRTNEGPSVTEDDRPSAEDFAAVLDDGRVAFLTILSNLDAQSTDRIMQRLDYYWRHDRRIFADPDFPRLLFAVDPDIWVHSGPYRFVKSAEFRRVVNLLILNSPEPVADNEEVGPKTYMERVLAAVKDELDRRVGRYAEVGRSLESEWGPEDLGRALVGELIAEPSRWSKYIGPVLRRSSLADRTGLDADTIQALAKDFRIIELTTTDEVVVYPEFQLDGSDFLKGLDEVLARFAPNSIDGWTLAAWFTHPQVDAGGTSLVELLRRGDREVALQLARDAARRFSQ